MKKIAAHIALVLCMVTASGQNPLEQVLKTYFRTHPFEMKFSSFITSLQKDPWFAMETFDRRTDSTFFFLSGAYKNYNPFHFTPKELRLIVAEEEIIHRDSLQTHDTIMNLQLMGITDSGFVNSKIVEKEFNRFNKNQSGRFSTKTYESYDDKGKMITEVYNYFMFPFSIAPVTIAWSLLPASNKYTFIITIRFKMRQNAADLIVAPNEQL